MKISNCVPSWLYSLVKWIRVISFQALMLSFQRRTLRLYTVTVVLFDSAIVTWNFRRVQLTFSFLSTADDLAPIVSRFSLIYAINRFSSGSVYCRGSMFSQLVSSRFFLVLWLLPTYIFIFLPAFSPMLVGLRSNFSCQLISVSSPSQDRCSGSPYSSMYRLVLLPLVLLVSFCVRQ